MLYITIFVSSNGAALDIKLWYTHIHIHIVIDNSSNNSSGNIALQTLLFLIFCLYIFWCDGIFVKPKKDSSWKCANRETKWFVVMVVVVVVILIWLQFQPVQLTFYVTWPYRAFMSYFMSFVKVFFFWSLSSSFVSFLFNIFAIHPNSKWSLQCAFKTFSPKDTYARHIQSKSFLPLQFTSNVLNFCTTMLVLCECGVSVYLLISPFFKFCLFSCTAISYSHWMVERLHAKWLLKFVAFRKIYSCCGTNIKSLSLSHCYQIHAHHSIAHITLHKCTYTETINASTFCMKEASRMCIYKNLFSISQIDIFHSSTRIPYKLSTYDDVQAFYVQQTGLNDRLNKKTNREMFACFNVLCI